MWVVCCFVKVLFLLKPRRWILQNVNCKSIRRQQKLSSLRWLGILWHNFTLTGKKKNPNNPRKTKSRNTPERSVIRLPRESRRAQQYTERVVPSAALRDEPRRFWLDCRIRSSRGRHTLWFYHRMCSCVGEACLTRSPLDASRTSSGTWIQLLANSSCLRIAFKMSPRPQQQKNNLAS